MQAGVGCDAAGGILKQDNGAALAGDDQLFDELPAVASDMLSIDGQLVFNANLLRLRKGRNGGPGNPSQGRLCHRYMTCFLIDITPIGCYPLEHTFYSILSSEGQCVKAESPSGATSRPTRKNNLHDD